MTRPPRSTVAISVAVAALLSIVPALPASANDHSSLVSTLAALSPEFRVNVGNSESLAADVASGDALPVLSNTGETTGVAIRPVEAEASGEVSVLSDGREVIEKRDRTSTLAQRKVDGSVQIITTIESPLSPTEYAYDIELPEGSHLQAAEDGSVVAFGEDGEFVAGVHAPWAVDANGAAVPTRFEIDGTRLTQAVDHGTEYAYPVMADPWLGAELYGGVGITNTSEGYVVTTTPTEWGAVHSGVNNLSMWWAHADEVKGKMPGGYAWTLSLQEQLYCHIAGYPVSANPSYDLESWKPHVRWEDQIPSKCLGGYSVGS